MPAYVFRCAKHGEFELVRKMSEAGNPATCPDCGLNADRVFTAPPVVFACDGFHSTDYGKGNDGQTGDKRELLNKRWSKAWNEPAPPPARDIKKNSTEKV